MEGRRDHAGGERSEGGESERERELRSYWHKLMPCVNIGFLDDGSTERIPKL